jgi:phosphoribosylamine--glycine ligase
VLEFNCRLGDPETQPILLRLRSDLAGLIEAALGGTLDKADAQWDRWVALAVVLAAHGYPEAPRKGDVIGGLPEEPGEDYHVFHAGTTLAAGRTLTDGGRVLAVTALGDIVRLAQRRARNRRSDSASMECSCGATSGTARPVRTGAQAERSARSSTDQRHRQGE